MNLCTLCRYFKFESQEGYACDTCGGDGSLDIGCSKSHWSADGLGTARNDFYQGIRHGLTCPDFDALTAEEIGAM